MKIATFLVGLLLLSCSSNQNLPAPTVIDGFWGTFEIDKNINVFGENPSIDQYLGRDDVVYRDMRMLIDPANYEAIGGDSYLSGFIDGFEVVPFPFITKVQNLPIEVGNTYQGETLYELDDQEQYQARYHESALILEELFPKNKIIFLMCGGGGYAMMMKNMLIALGWDQNNLYNVGCYWQYQGANNINVKESIGEETVYLFHRVSYKLIDFSTLTLINET